MKKMLLLSGIILFLSSCAPIVYMTIVSKDFESKKISNASLCIAAFRNVSIKCSGNVTEELGKGDEKQVIFDHFTTTLLSKLQTKSIFTPVSFDTPVVALMFKRTVFDIGDKLTLDLPNETAAIQCGKEAPDFILFIQDLSIRTENIKGNGIGFKMPAQPDPEGLAWNHLERENFSITSGIGPKAGYTPPVTTPTYKMQLPNEDFYDKYLIYTCNFAFWDNHRHTAAVYGRIMASSKSKTQSTGWGKSPTIIMENWNEVDEKFVNYLLKRTPFEK
jgi:hypothetical protein